MRVVLTALVVVATVLGQVGGAQAQSSDRPNVVLIITDDVGYGDIGSYGAPDIKTPNIDSLARNGTRLTDFYAAPNCSPTRAALISGRYQQRVRIEVPLGAANGPAGDQGLRATGRSLPQLLKNNGYRTGAHWQVAPGLQEGVQPCRARVRLLLRLQERADRLLPAHRSDRSARSVRERRADRTPPGTRPTCSPSVPSSSSRRMPAGRSSWKWPTTPHIGRSRCRTTRRLLPNNARFVQPQEDPTNTRRDYAAILERADRGVGQILATLERRGLTRNTLVIYTQDNGGEWLSRNAPLFHRKNTVWEGRHSCAGDLSVAGPDSRRQDVIASGHRDGSDGHDPRRDQLHGATRGAPGGRQPSPASAAGRDAIRAHAVLQDHRTGTPPARGAAR